MNESQSQGIKGMIHLYRGLPKPVYALFIATIMNGLGIFVYPFMVLLLTQHLGYSDAWTGIFMSLSALAYLPGSFIGGKLADKIGRKKVMIFSQLLASAMFVICGFLGKSHLVPLFIFLNLMFDGATDPARSALMTDITTQENRQVSFSLNYLGFNIGFAVGPVVAGLFFYSAPSWLFFGNAIAATVAIMYVAITVPESKPDQEAIEASYHTDSTEKAHDGGWLSALLSRPRLLILALCITFFSFSYSQSLFALPLYTTQLYGEAGATLYGSIMSLNAIVVVASNAFLVMALRRYHPLRNIAIAGVLYAIGFSCLGLVQTPIWFYVLATVYTLGEVIDATNTHYYIANNTPISHRARFSAVLPVIMGTGHAIAPLIGGQVSTRYGLDVLWVIVGITAALGTLGILILYWTEDPESRKKNLRKIP
ncbi:MFS transporter [Pleomorphochaeta sp. DL1XJH-081]|jgi:MFS family permease|uniref:MFS transporter n=1 Tax=Pleomorphochaeta sp. DL1XJH-081 TaxID=3409690 RepID=UPI003BB578E1